MPFIPLIPFRQVCQGWKGVGWGWNVTMDYSMNITHLNRVLPLVPYGTYQTGDNISCGLTLRASITSDSSWETRGGPADPGRGVGRWVGVLSLSRQQELQPGFQSRWYTIVFFYSATNWITKESEKNSVLLFIYPAPHPESKIQMSTGTYPIKKKKVSKWFLVILYG